MLFDATPGTCILEGVRPARIDWRGHGPLAAQAAHRLRAHGIALDDRESWIKSVADVALGKSLDQIQDEEEPKLHKALQESIEALVAHKGLMAAGKDQLAVSVTMPTGEHVKRYIPQLTEDAEVTSRLAKLLEGLSADERLQLISLILETENTAVTWE